MAESKERHSPWSQGAGLAAGLVAGVLAAWGVCFAPVPATLRQAHWQLEAVQTAEGSVLWTPMQGHFLMTFGAHAVTGSAQCNSFQGAVHVTPLLARLSFGSVLSTAMLCGLEAEKEAMFFAALDTAAKYHVQAEQLSISFEGSTKVLIFKNTDSGESRGLLPPASTEGQCANPTRDRHG